MIEKDEEYIIEADDMLRSNYYQQRNQFGEAEPYDNVKRLYFPIREKYIKIVKHCRKICIDGFEKRGRKDFKRTCKNLIRTRKDIIITRSQNLAVGSRCQN